MKAIAWYFYFSLFAAIATDDDSVRLAYTFKIGEVYTMTQRSHQTVKQFIMGIEQPGENVYAGEMELKVISLTETGARLQAQFIRLKHASKSMMGEQIMDSEGSEETAQNSVFRAMMRKSFFIVLNSSGKVENVEGHENLWAGVAAIGLDDDTEARLKESLNQMLTKNALKSNIEQALVYYSEKRVKPGDSWRSTGGFPMGFPIQIDNAWSLATLDAASANVNAEGIYTTTDKEKVITLVNGLKAKVDLTGTQSTKASVNIKTGWPSELKIVSSLKGTMTLLAGGMLPMDMELPMEISGETSYTFVRK